MDAHQGIRTSSISVGGGGDDADGGREDVTSTSPTPLVVDALNKLTSYFLPVYSVPVDTSPWKLLTIMKDRVEDFLRACEASHISPHFVIDDGYASAEAAQKWKKRREAEVRGNERRVPLGADSLLADTLRECGAPVYTVEGRDGDDVAARLAYELGPRSLILSADRDMFRYSDFIADAGARVMTEFAFTFAHPPRSPGRPFVDGEGKKKTVKHLSGHRRGVGATLVLMPSPTQCTRAGVSQRWGGRRYSTRYAFYS